MKITSFVLKNEIGDRVEILNFGARIMKWSTLIDQENRNIILGYKHFDDYLEDPFYMGAVVGPYANRIGNAETSILDTRINLDPNQAPHHLHGGHQNLSNQIWTGVEKSSNSITLKCKLEDGLSGYPGNRVFSVNYHLSDESCLSIKIQAQTDKTSIIGPTSHPYFNLAGFGNPHLGHKLQIFSEQYTKLDSMAIPTGEIVSVLETELDYRQTRQLEAPEEKDRLDHNFIHSSSLSEQQAILTSPDDKLSLAVSSNYPGLQVYTGNYLSDSFEPQSGICLEPQFYPDSPNHTAFPYQHTNPETLFEKVIKYQLLK